MMSNVDNFGDSFKIMVFVYAIIGFVATEFILVKEAKFYGNGLDDAAIFGTILSVASGVAMISDWNYTLASFIVAATSFFFYLRYINIPALLIACCSFIYGLSIFMFDTISFGKSLLPFVFIILSFIVYFVCKKIEINLVKPYYTSGLILVKCFCLVLFYLAGNYFIVRSLSFELRDDYTIQDSEIPFSWFFWSFTFIVPVLYLYFGVKNRDKMMLWLGALSLGFSFFSFRMYHHVLPPEIALTLGGVVLFVIAYFAIKKLKDKEEGITFKANRFEFSNALLQLEVVASAAQFGVKPEVAAPESPIEFGGGGYSGGGSGGEF